MATLDQRIADLKEEIKGYETKLNSATTEKQLVLFAGLINFARETLNRLLDEKKAHLTNLGISYSSRYFILTVSTIATFLFNVCTIVDSYRFPFLYVAK